jgi:hypothetical protein
MAEVAAEIKELGDKLSGLTLKQAVEVAELSEGNLRH